MKSKYLKMGLSEKEKLLVYFYSFITLERQKKIESIALDRTHRVAVVTEDISHPHNISAVMRSCECFGIQQLHVIENEYRYKVNSGVTKGASNWIDIMRYNAPGSNNTEVAYRLLKQAGYKIVATSLGSQNYSLHELPIDSKIALVLGSEQDGLSDYAINHADASVKIPMYGFTQSLNVSVSAALCLYDITQRLRSSDINWRLDYHEQLDIKLGWLVKTIPHIEKIEKAFFLNV